MNTVNETREHIEIMLKRESEGSHLYASIVLKSNQAIIGTAMIFNFDKEANQAEIGYGDLAIFKENLAKGRIIRKIIEINIRV